MFQIQQFTFKEMHLKNIVYKMMSICPRPQLDSHQTPETGPGVDAFTNRWVKVKVNISIYCYIFSQFW